MNDKAFVFNKTTGGQDDRNDTLLSSDEAYALLEALYKPGDRAWRLIAMVKNGGCNSTREGMLRASIETERAKSK